MYGFACYHDIVFFLPLHFGTMLRAFFRRGREIVTHASVSLSRYLCRPLRPLPAGL